MLQREKSELSDYLLGFILKGLHNFLLLYSRLLHLDLFCMSLFVVQFGLQPNQLPGFVGPLMGLTALLLPFLFMVVQAVAMPLAV